MIVTTIIYNICLCIITRYFLILWAFYIYRANYVFINRIHKKSICLLEQLKTFFLLIIYINLFNLIFIFINLIIIIIIIFFFFLYYNFIIILIIFT